MEFSLGRREDFDVAGARISAIVSGSRSNPPLLLLHGYPCSSRCFRNVIPELSEVCFVIAPDLPGFGQSGLIPDPTFTRCADLIEGLLTKLGVTDTYLYAHDFGAPVVLELAMRDPRRVLGLIVQNANAHRSGFGPAWQDTLDFWRTPSKEKEQRATAHMTFEGTRDQYLRGVPVDIAAQISADNWIEDWRIMSQAGHLELQRALLADYGRYAASFDAVGQYLHEHQPRALMLWGRHDSFFDSAEILSWLQALPRMEAHVFDGAHMLLETHSAQCAELMVDFVRRAPLGTGTGGAR